ncbi:sugar transferase [Candidatus Gottesmanbacteria bacterium]|nr:sugar transferase [Candidatus Gottesmanbacteria bacterium]
MYKQLKRLVDILGAIFLLVLFSPLCLMTAILIKTDAGPIFADTPERVGLEGRLFKMYKFRSMVEAAHILLRTDPKYQKKKKKYKRNSYKLASDPRITPIGKIIRKHSIDEIPNLLNVLKGEMSIVGPRAYYPDELKSQLKKYPYTKKLVSIVLSVKPGVTGAWQVSGRSEVNFDKRIAMDAQYAQKKSILYDFGIMIKTPWAMVSGKGAM